MLSFLSWLARALLLLGCVTFFFPWAPLQARAAPPAAAAVSFLKDVTVGERAVAGGPYTLRFSTAEVFNSGTQYALGTLGAPRLVPTPLSWMHRLLRSSGTMGAPRSYAYALLPTGTSANCGGCGAKAGLRGNGCRGGELVVTCGAWRAKFTAREPRQCVYELSYSTTEACPVDAAPLLRKAEVTAAKKAPSLVGPFGTLALAGVGVFVTIARHRAEWSWLDAAAPPRTPPRALAAPRAAVVAADCPVCMSPITGDFGRCSGPGRHAVCAECLQHRARSQVGDLQAQVAANAAPVAAAAALSEHLMTCPLCPRDRRAGVSYAAAREVLARAGNALGSAELECAAALRNELVARAGVNAALEGCETRQHSAAAVAALAGSVVHAARFAACPGCGAEYTETTDACMHAFCRNAGCTHHSSTAFCGYCFVAGCRAERCLLNPQRPSSMNPGPEVKQKAFVLMRCRAIAALLGSHDAAVAEAALARAEVQAELRTLLCSQSDGAVNLEAIRNATWRLRPNSPLAQYAAPMRTHLTAAFVDAQRTPRATSGHDGAAAQRALEAALAAQVRASRDAEQAQQAMRQARDARRVQLLQQYAVIRGELSELGAAPAVA